MDYEKNKIEYRHSFGGEVRSLHADDDADTIKLTGLAAVFDTWAEIGPGLRERIRPGAFAKALPTSDVRLLVNHEGLPLARTSSGTMKLFETRQGLEMEANLDRADPDVRALIPKIERGDLSQFSFAFDVASDGQEFKGEERTITEFREIFDVSLVTFPAFESTRITALRSRELHDAEQALHDFQASRLRETLLGPRPCGCGEFGTILGNLIDANQGDVSNAAIGAEAGISASTVGQIKNGSIDCPPIDRLRGIARAIGVSVSSLVSAAERDGCNYEDD